MRPPPPTSGGHRAALDRPQPLASPYVSPAGPPPHAGLAPGAPALQLGLPGDGHPTAHPVPPPVAGRWARRVALCPPPPCRQVRLRALCGALPRTHRASSPLPLMSGNGENQSPKLPSTKADVQDDPGRIETFLFSGKDSRKETPNSHCGQTLSDSGFLFSPVCLSSKRDAPEGEKR